VARLMRETGTTFDQIGRLEVATETIMDHSKSIKTVLMQLFTESGNSDVEGVDTLNACYAGTNALFNSVAWIESSAWDGRLAMVVTADIAEYAKGAARPTGGCVAAEEIVEHDPLVFSHSSLFSLLFLLYPTQRGRRRHADWAERAHCSRSRYRLASQFVFSTTRSSYVCFRRVFFSPRPAPGLRASHMAHSYDFFKPHLSSPYPVVDGKGSAMCYLRSLDTCYQRLAEKRQRLVRLSVCSRDCTLILARISPRMSKSRVFPLSAAGRPVDLARHV
jgi:hypothetical protein